MNTILNIINGYRRTKECTHELFVQDETRRVESDITKSYVIYGSNASIEFIGKVNHLLFVGCNDVKIKMYEPPISSIDIVRSAYVHIECPSMPLINGELSRNINIVGLPIYIISHYSIDWTLYSKNMNINPLESRWYNLVEGTSALNRNINYVEVTMPL